MKLIFILLILINLGFSTLGFAKSTTIDDISWTLNANDVCEDISNTKFKKELSKMLHGRGYVLNTFIKEYQMREYIQGKGKGKAVFWMFPNKTYCKEFKKHIEKLKHIERLLHE